MSRRISTSCLTYTFVIYMFTARFINTGNVERLDKLEGKIIGGEYTIIEEFPHCVYLTVECDIRMGMCGSTVLNQRILVTAAHCLTCEFPLIVTAHAGHERIKEATAIRDAALLEIHPLYSTPNLENDIGLIALSRNLPLGDNIKRVIIKPSFPKNTYAFVAGWGDTDDITRARPKQLKKLKVNLLSRAACLKILHIYPGMLCAGNFYDQNNRPTWGDSGSALITSKHQQVGIVSFRKPEKIGVLVYTNVSYHYYWIQKTAKQMYCPLK